MQTWTKEDQQQLEALHLRKAQAEDEKRKPLQTLLKQCFDAITAGEVEAELICRAGSYIEALKLHLPEVWAVEPGVGTPPKQNNVLDGWHLKLQEGSDGIWLHISSPAHQHANFHLSQNSNTFTSSVARGFVDAFNRRG